MSGDLDAGADCAPGDSGEAAYWSPSKDEGKGPGIWGTPSTMVSGGVGVAIGRRFWRCRRQKWAEEIQLRPISIAGSIHDKHHDFVARSAALPLQRYSANRVPANHCQRHGGAAAARVRIWLGSHGPSPGSTSKLQLSISASELPRGRVTYGVLSLSSHPSTPH